MNNVNSLGARDQEVEVWTEPGQGQWDTHTKGQHFWELAHRVVAHDSVGRIRVYNVYLGEGSLTMIVCNDYCNHWK